MVEERKVRCNRCMQVFPENQIIVVDEGESCPFCSAEGVLSDIEGVVMVCSKCGSPNVRRNANCQWNVREQKWEVVSLFDSATCEDCEEECTIIEQAV